MTHGERWDRFGMRSKPHVRLEVMRSGKTTLEKAAKIALMVDSALCGVEMPLSRTRLVLKLPQVLIPNQ